VVAIPAAALKPLRGHLAEFVDDRADALVSPVRRRRSCGPEISAGQ